jgi:flagellar protein FliL
MAKEKKEELDEPKQQEAAPPKKSKLKLFIIIFIGLVVIAGGATAGFLVLSKSDSKKHGPEQKPAVLSVWPMDAFVVNIIDANTERYLKLVVQLEVSDPTVITELEQIKPKLRDSILDLLTAKTYKDLMDLSGKQRLREDIAGRINNILTKGKVTKVYFTDFVVQ